jgi:hypothetical protein
VPSGARPTPAGRPVQIAVSHSYGAAATTSTDGSTTTVNATAPGTAAQPALTDPIVRTGPAGRATASTAAISSSEIPA